MKYDRNGKQQLQMVQVQSDRTISNIAGMLKLESLDADSAMALSERVAEQMRAMTSEERQATIITSAMALADVNELCETLGCHLEEVAGEIRRLKSHTVAATAYRRSRAAVAGSR